MLSTTLRRQRTSASLLAAALRPIGTSAAGSCLIRTVHTERHVILSPPSSNTCALNARTRPSIAVLPGARHLVIFRQARAFHATPRRQDDFSFDITNVSVALVGTGVATLLLTRKGTKVLLVIVMLVGGNLVYTSYRLRQEPLEELRVWRIEALIALAEIFRRVRDEEATAAAITGVEGAQVWWLWGRTFQLKDMQYALDQLAELIVLRLSKDMDEQDRARGLEDDLEARAASLLVRDCEIARMVVSKAGGLKREDYRPMIARLVAVDISNEGPAGLVQAMDEILGAQQR